MLPGFDAKPLKRASKRQAQRGRSNTGVVEMFGGSAAPDGALLCLGQAVSRQVYADLYAKIGTTWGTGDGSTTFNVPDMKDRMPIGAGNLYALAATGGSKDAIVVSHSHTATTAITDPGHTHSGVVGTAAVGNVPAGGTTVVPTGNTSVGSATTSITAATTVNSNGASGTDANLPPYVGMNFIIWT